MVNDPLLAFLKAILVLHSRKYGNHHTETKGFTSVIGRILPTKRLKNHMHSLSASDQLLWSKDYFNTLVLAIESSQREVS